MIETKKQPTFTASTIIVNSAAIDTMSLQQKARQAEEEARAAEEKRQQEIVWQKAIGQIREVLIIAR